MKLKSNVELCEADGEYLGLVVKNDMPTAMLRSNVTGYFLLSLMCGEVSLSDLKKRLIEKFDASEEAVSADVEKFIAELLRCGLLDE